MKPCVRMFLLSAIICGDLDVCFDNKEPWQEIVLVFLLSNDWLDKNSLRLSGYVQVSTRNHMSFAVFPPGRRLSMSMSVCTCNYQAISHEVPFELHVRKISFSLGILFLVPIFLCDLR